MKETSIEVLRTNVTVAEFLSYVKRACKAKGLECDIIQEDFENPESEYMRSYTVVDGKKLVHEAHYQVLTTSRRKHASYTTPEGFTRYYLTDEMEEVEEKKLVHSSSVWDGEDAPCKAETIRMFAHDFQTYVLNFDGTCFNEICEFEFDEGNRGHGYYYRLERA